MLSLITKQKKVMLKRNVIMLHISYVLYLESRKTIILVWFGWRIFYNSTRVIGIIIYYLFFDRSVIGIIVDDISVTTWKSFT